MNSRNLPKETVLLELYSIEENKKFPVALLSYEDGTKFLCVENISTNYQVSALIQSQKLLLARGLMLNVSPPIERNNSVYYGVDTIN